MPAKIYPMNRGIRTVTYSFAKYLPVALPKLTCAPVRSVTVRFRTFFPGVACHDELSNPAKYNHLPITAIKAKNMIPTINDAPNSSLGSGGLGGFGRLRRNAPKP